MFFLGARKDFWGFLGMGMEWKRWLTYGCCIDMLNPPRGTTIIITDPLLDPPATESGWDSPAGGIDPISSLVLCEILMRSKRRHTLYQGKGAVDG